MAEGIWGEPIDEPVGGWELWGGEPHWGDPAVGPCPNCGSDNTGSRIVNYGRGEYKPQHNCGDCLSSWRPKPVENFEHPDPWMDNEPGGTTFPAEWTKRAAVDQTLRDPNEGFQTNVNANQNNAYEWGGAEGVRDPLNYTRPNDKGQTLGDNAMLIDTEWSTLKQHDKPDYERMKHAIENAFRVVLLSPQKDLYWNTVHYQDLADIHSSDPYQLWNHLENHRQSWNVDRWGEDARFSHRPYQKSFLKYQKLVQQMHPNWGHKQVEESAGRTLFKWTTQAEEKLEQEQSELPPEKRMDELKFHHAVNKALTERFKMRLEARQKKMDKAERLYQEENVPALFAQAGAEPTQHPELDPQLRQYKLYRYGAFMGGHLRAIAQVAEYIDEILKAALEDVHEHNGQGYHFRSTCMQLNIPGVGPKVCSFAWLLLQPATSQLATIDTHMMDVLGYKNQGKETALPNREYFRLERELQAGRDAAGYNGVPLGQFQWAMWDHKRTGLESHQDHSGLKALEPEPYNAVGWEGKAPKEKGTAWTGPGWWQETQQARDAVGNDWLENQATQTKKDNIPFQVTSSWKIAVSQRTPWFVHPASGERIEGQPGQTLMQHLTQTMHLSTPEIWAQVAEAGKA